MLPVHQQRNHYNMTDANKPKLQLRPTLSINGDKAPSPATKLLINHGKPNFTIQRSPKAQNGNVNPMSPTPQPAKGFDVKINNNEFVVKSTKFNGVFKPSNLSEDTKQILQRSGSVTNGNDNEAAKVVLRRAKVVQSEMKKGEDENVPEFIRRQRRIQERLANQNILDFENRRSGYFTQVMISPSSPNRQSFVETMSSPAVKPGLEIPPPLQHEHIHEETQQKQEQEQVEEQQEQLQLHSELEHKEETVHVTPVTMSGQDEEEEVAKAIEEVNKAVEGEDDDKMDDGERIEHVEEQIEQTLEPAVVAVSTLEHVDETKPEMEEKLQEETPVAAIATTTAVMEETPVKETQVEAEPIVAAIVTSGNEVSDEAPNGVAEEHLQNGHTNSETTNTEVTISHTNGLNGPSLPSPDPKGEKGVNYEPKTVVSFSQELGNDVNKYPDTVKVIKDVQTLEVDDELRELTKLKFEIKADDKDIEVKPVLITETA